MKTPRLGCERPAGEESVYLFVCLLICTVDTIA